MSAASHQNPDEIIAALGLKPHPEGGWFAETFRDEGAGNARGASTAIYFLLKAGEQSAWHRVDAAEVWHYYAGDPLELSIVDSGAARRMQLGPNLAGGERPQAIVPPHAWQAARPLGAWTLVGCTVSPAFEFKSFEMADDATAVALSGLFHEPA